MTMPMTAPARKLKITDSPFTWQDLVRMQEADPHHLRFTAPAPGVYIADVLLQKGGALRTLLVVKE